MVDRNELKDNVIDFPKGKTTPSKVVELPVVYKQEPKVNVVNKLTISLAIVFAISLAVNSIDEFSFGSSDIGSRSLASVGKYNISARDVSLEEKLAKKLAQPSQRRPASLGKNPTRADEFKFGFLESKYAVKFYQGKIQEVEFANSNTIEVEPRYLTNRSEFLNNYKDLFSVPFSSSVSLNREVIDQKIHETYALLNEDQTKVGQIFFELDVYGRLLGMKVSTIQ